MFMEEMQAPLEALLFARGEPVTAAQLEEILQLDEESLAELLALYQETLEERKSGLMLHRVAGGFQLVTRPECHAYVQKLLEMELVEEVGRKPVIGRPILYGTTDVFLKCFGLNALSDLPALPALEEVAEEGDVQLELIAADEAASVQAEASLENTAGESSGSSTAENVENAEKIGEALPLEEKSD